jgi:hypothetical protein
MEAGLLAPEMARALENQYRIKLPGSRHVYAIAPNEPDEPESAPDTEERMSDTATAAIPPPAPAPAPPVSPEITRLLVRARDVAAVKAAEGAAPPTDEFVLERLIEQAARVPGLDARILEMEPRARDGEAYRLATVNETWGEYVRAGLADGVVEADQKELWTRSPLPQVVKERDHYRKLGAARLGGGRKTTEGEQAAPPPPTVPTHLYAA